MSFYIPELDPQAAWHQRTFVETNMPVLKMALLMGIPDKAPPSDTDENVAWMRTTRNVPSVPMPITYATWLLWVSFATSGSRLVDNGREPATNDLFLVLMQTWDALFRFQYQHQIVYNNPKDEA